ncbi:PPOX class F420-dependent oxidoreductase [Nonomuraea dietziae]|uniref:PPOX class F420-dependent oxidoreductase n=1 Tax=Nonomuraea dietziae TaxID=65515 RepID=UPI0033DD7564
MSRRDDPQADRFFALRTFRRDGSAVSTPIWLAEAGDHWYGYTPSRSWKALRLRRDPRVEAAPSDFDGQPRGPWRRGHARLMPASELHVARRALREKYGARFHLFALVTLAGRPRPRGGGAVGIEITLEAADAR